MDVLIGHTYLTQHNCKPNTLREWSQENVENIKDFISKDIWFIFPMVTKILEDNHACWLDLLAVLLNLAQCPLCTMQYKQCLDFLWKKISISPSLQPNAQKAAKFHPTLQHKSLKNFDMLLDGIATRIYGIQVIFNLTCSLKYNKWF